MTFGAVPGRLAARRGRARPARRWPRSAIALLADRPVRTTPASTARPTRRRGRSRARRSRSSSPAARRSSAARWPCSRSAGGVGATRRQVVQQRPHAEARAARRGRGARRRAAPRATASRSPPCAAQSVWPTSQTSSTPRLSCAMRSERSMSSDRVAPALRRIDRVAALEAEVAERVQPAVHAGEHRQRAARPRGRATRRVAATAWAAPRRPASRHRDPAPSCGRRAPSSPLTAAEGAYQR